MTQNQLFFGDFDKARGGCGLPWEKFNLKLNKQSNHNTQSKIALFAIGGFYDRARQIE